MSTATQAPTAVIGTQRRVGGGSGPHHQPAMHGLNVSPSSNAQWFYDRRARLIVEVVNTVVALLPIDGFGDWNIRDQYAPVQGVARGTPDNQQRPIHALQRPHGSLYDDDIRMAAVAQPRGP